MTSHDRDELAMRAGALLAVDPVGLGGLVIHGSSGPVRDRYLAMLRECLPAPWRRLPLHAGEDRLVGGLDLVATLKAGRPMIEKGVLAAAHGGVVVLPMAERLPVSTVSLLTSCLDQGEIQGAREGLTFSDKARFAVIALDESLAGEEPMAPKLADRLAFHVDLGALDPRGAEPNPKAFDASTIAAARITLRAVYLAPALLAALVSTALRLGIGSLRPALLAVKAARCAAALDARTEASEEDAALAAQLVLAPRAQALPEQPEDAPAPPEPPAETPSPETWDHPVGDVILEAAVAAIPPDLLAQIEANAGRRAAENRPGRAGPRIVSPTSGRPKGTRQGLPRHGHRLSLIDTMRAAAPWQSIRRQETASSDHRRVIIRKDDLRVRRFQERTESTVVFLVDASGSTALHRLAEAKGAIELLLADCYVRREQVALITFRGKTADLLLAPTRSLARAKRELAGLPGGGGTPLAAGLDAATELATMIRRKGQTPLTVLLTDGRPNVRRDGIGGRADAEREGLTAARAFKASGLASLVIDTGRRPQAYAQELAQGLGGRYLPLPHANAQQLNQAVRQSRHGA